MPKFHRQIWFWASGIHLMLFMISVYAYESLNKGEFNEINQPFEIYLFFGAILYVFIFIPMVSFVAYLLFDKNKSQT